MAFETIIYEVREKVAWITLNRPEVHNAQSDTLRHELKTALEKARDDDGVCVEVITGAGDKAFSAGADIGAFTLLRPLDVIRNLKGKKRAYEVIRETLKPVIAMVNGLALGAGFELAMACDMVVASDNARFGQPEIKVGVIPGGGGTQMLPRLVGEKKAKELIFTGKLINADEALQIGLINLVVPKEKLRKSVEDLANQLKQQSPSILKLAKLAVGRSLEVPLSAGMEIEKELFAMCFSTNDQKEGAKAFLEKRRPEYTGT